MNPRRVVTGTVGGKAVVTSDERVEPITIVLAPGSEFIPVWGADAPPALPQDGAEPTWHTWFPPAGGFRFAYLVIPPDSSVTHPDDLASGVAEAQQKLPGMVELLEPDGSGMHRSDTIDWVVVLDGTVWLELGAEGVELTRGDCVVQNGTRHAWHNRTDEPATVLAAIVGAVPEQ